MGGCRTGKTGCDGAPSYETSTLLKDGKGKRVRERYGWRKFVFIAFVVILSCWWFLGVSWHSSTIETFDLSADWTRSSHVDSEGAALAASFTNWEFRVFFPRNDKVPVEAMRKALSEAVQDVLEVADLIGFSKKKSKVKRRKPENRQDVYLDIGEPSVGLKFRGQESDMKGEYAGELLELKLLHRQKTEAGVLSNRSYVLEDWDKLIRHPLGKHEQGHDAVVAVLQDAADEYSARRTGSPEDRFRFSGTLETLVLDALELAKNSFYTRRCTLDKVRYLDKVEFRQKNINVKFKFEATAVQVQGQSWWSFAVEGPIERLASVFVDVVLRNDFIHSRVAIDDALLMGYPEFIMHVTGDQLLDSREAAPQGRR